MSIRSSARRRFTWPAIFATVPVAAVLAFAAALPGAGAAQASTAHELAGTSHELAGTAAGTQAASHTTGNLAAPQAAGTPAAPQIVPKPVSMTMGSGEFTLALGTRITVAPGSSAATPVAQDLAGYLRPATGYQIPVVSGGSEPGSIALAVGSQYAVPGDPDGEGYRLTVTSTGVMLAAQTAHGLYNGIQTIRQLLPAWINSHSVMPGPWTLPAVAITDHPRYTYRGVMLDIARHYETPQATEQLIDQAAAYKINVFHLHLSDDQGFRIVINGFPNLTTIGGQGSVGTGGRTMDPGGYWTQAQYKAVVADATAHDMTLIPEVDSPGHNNAIIMSEYNDTANPLLNGHPQDINCGKNNPPMWDYTGDVGYSALCPDSQNTWTIMTAIIHQLDAMTPGRYHDMGGDEVPSTILSQSQYADFINKEMPIISAQGKNAMGWADMAGPGTNPPAGSVAEYWNPASGSSSGTITGTEAVQKGMQVVMAPANHTYLDQKYKAGSAGNVPPTLGLNWACGTGCDVDQFYNWDPGSYVTGVTDSNVIGVEGAMWAETVVNLSNVDYMVFPRLPALAEVAWSPKASRTSESSPAYQDFAGRLAAQGGRWLAGAVNFYPTPEVPWRLDLTAGTVAASGSGVDGAVATLAAPGYPASAVNAAIDWGDGSSSAGTISGTPATSTTVNGLYAVNGSHSYAHPGVYDGTVTVGAAGAAPVTAHFTVRWH